MMEPKPFVYVGYFRCGHVNWIAIEPHEDDREERKSLWRDFKNFIVKGGWIERVPRDQIPALTMCECAVPK